jgi:hypothetical protein
VKRCDCGSPATRDGQCARCEFLDGPIDPGRAFVAPSIIASLRLHVALSLTDLQNEIKIDPSTIQRTLYRMMSAGRVKRHVDEHVVTGRERVVAGRNGAYSCTQGENTTRWMYRLAAV